MRQCVKCGEVKSLEAFELTEKWRRRKCAACRSAEARAWNLAHPERVKVSKKAHYARHRERVIAQTGAWYRANRERARQRARAYNADPEQKIRQAAYNRAYYERNRERVLAQVHEYYQRTRVENPERLTASRIAYRVRKQGAEGIASPDSIRSRWEYYAGLCYRCGNQADALDHVIPLIRGGTNWPANLRPICRSCNSSKRAKYLSELVS